MDKLLTLLTLQRQAQEAASRPQLLHIMTNESRKLVPYRQCIVWSSEAWGGVTLEKISGNAILDPHSAYAQNLGKIISGRNFGATAIEEIKMPEEDSYLTLVRMDTPTEGVLGGLCFETSTPLSDGEKELAKEMALSYTPAFALFAVRGGRGLWRELSSIVIRRKYFLLGLCVLALFPTRLGVTAPVEIVPEDAGIITAPFSGIIGHVKVAAGESVKAGDVLLEMDNTALKADADLAGEDLKMSDAQLSKAHRQALSTPDKATDLGSLEADRKEKEIRLRYAREMQEKTKITAPRAGVAIYTDKSALEGQPVQAGDVVMKIADPTRAEALIRIPVAALVPIDKKSAVSFFLAVGPTHSYDAEISSIGYEASPDADGNLTYKVRARIETGETLRIGWQGTARIKGHWTILSYAILRRPILSLRQMTGL